MIGCLALARRVAAAVLVLVLTLAGAGRDAPGMPEIRIGDLAGPICHSARHGSPTPSDPGDPASHACCDLCALCASVTLPEAPDLAVPAPIVMAGRPAGRALAAPHVAQSRTPRQAQAPPVA